MKLRIVPMAVTAALSAALLFGGWYAYGHYGVEKPLDRIAQAVPGVETAQTSRSASEVKLNVSLSPDADLASVYRQIEQNGAQSIGGKKLELAVNAPSDPTLEKMWGQALFNVAEAMDHRTYSGIQDAMTELEQKHPGLTTATEMDDTNVYVTLKYQDAVKYVILPREPQKLEVWPNA
ncbi:hypothetical protein [Cohnella zeiphila]|uniref:Uncharacterized protein n=1 Tax=Cohnella zeiphila TaxID=2761120 RepID=A0A7X0VYY5_9BACL|nr:hypothetical protein [Cohnella zeiphila]MBB6735471.1 hypothetical protein [Cohnella zeiphila]